MAKYDVTYSCGHTITEQLYGPTRERESKIAWAAKSLCPECYRNQAKAAASKANIGLPALVGTEKQIAWAMDIRAEYVGKPGWDAVSGQTSASWWINNRATIGSMMIKRAEEASILRKIVGLTPSEIFRQAHAYTRKVKAAYPGIDYKAQFGLILKEMYRQIAEAKAKMAA